MTVASDAEACLRSFRKCLEHAAAVHPRELSLIEDQLARLSLWIGNIRVFGPGRQSLDHRLREAPEVQDTTAGLLEALTYHVDKCSAILESLKPRDPLQPILALDKSLNKSIRAAADQISLLNKLSNTIRRASKTTQNIQAASSFQILDDEGNDAAGFMQKVFAHYVRDRFQATSEVIQQRLAATMVLRRKRVLYRRERYGDGPIGVEQVSSKPTVVAPHREATAPVSQHPGSGVQKRAESQRQSAIYSLTKSATTLAADHFRKAATPSVVSATKTVPLGSHEELSFPAAPLGAITMKVKQLSQQANSAYALRWKTVRELRNEAIWLEAVAAVGEVTCPFCFYALPAKDVADEMKWMMHVKSDLDAYVCLFDECDCPNELYTHTSQWLKHMRGHALRWKCKSHPDFMGFTREDFMKHLQTEHNSKLSEAQLGVLSDRSARATGPLFKACPLCDAKKVENGMEDHIVGHLRLLRLKSLPGYEDVGGEDAQDLSTQSSEAHSRETIQEAIPDNSSGVDSPFFGWNDADRSDVDENEWRNIEQGLKREGEEGHNLESSPGLSSTLTSSNLDAIQAARQAIEATPQDHPDQARLLNKLSLQLSNRYSRTGAMEDLEEAITISRKTIEVTKDDHPGQALLLNNLGLQLSNRYSRTGAIANLEEAIAITRKAIEIATYDHPNPSQATLLNNLGLQLSDRYSRTGAMKDLEEAITITQEAIIATPLDDLNRAMLLGNLGCQLSNRYSRTGDFDDLNRAIEVGREALDLTPAGHPDLAGRLSHLGLQLGNRYSRTGDFDDLNKAIEVGREALDLTPADHPELSSCLKGLSTHLSNRYSRTGEIGDLEDAIGLGERAVHATPEDHPDWSARLKDLDAQLKILKTMRNS